MRPLDPSLWKSVLRIRKPWIPRLGTTIQWKLGRKGSGPCTSGTEKPLCALVFKYELRRDAHSLEPHHCISTNPSASYHRRATGVQRGDRRIAADEALTSTTGRSSPSAPRAESLVRRRCNSIPHRRTEITLKSVEHAESLSAAASVPGQINKSRPQPSAWLGVGAWTCICFTLDTQRLCSADASLTQQQQRHRAFLHNAGKRCVSELHSYVWFLQKQKNTEQPVQVRVDFSGSKGWGHWAAESPSFFTCQRWPC